MLGNRGEGDRQDEEKIKRNEVVAIPRVIVELESLKDCAYDLKYHNKLQGFVYNLLKATPYENVHDKDAEKIM